MHGATIKISNISFVYGCW